MASKPKRSPRTVFKVPGKSKFTLCQDDHKKLVALGSINSLRATGLNSLYADHYSGGKGPDHLIAAYEKLATLISLIVDPQKNVTQLRQQGASP
jgi:hypothetical protein